jgi:hypothetical protein
MTIWDSGWAGAEGAGAGEQVALPAELEGVTGGEPDQGSCRGKAGLHLRDRNGRR